MNISSKKLLAFILLVTRNCPEMTTIMEEELNQVINDAYDDGYRDAEKLHRQA